MKIDKKKEEIYRKKKRKSTQIDLSNYIHKNVILFIKKKKYWCQTSTFVSHNSMEHHPGHLFYPLKLQT